MKSGVCESLGRAPYFLFFDTESKGSVFIENGAATSQGGTGIKAAQVIADNQASALLTPRCGQNAAEVLHTANIKLYKTTYDSIEMNIDTFIDGKLPSLSEIHAGYHHGGQSYANSCAER